MIPDKIMIRFMVLVLRHLNIQLFVQIYGRDRMTDSIVEQWKDLLLSTQTAIDHIRKEG